MKIKDMEVSVEDAMKLAACENLLLKRRKNSFLLSDFQINVLKKSGIDYLKYGSIRELLFDIEENLNNNYDDELDLVSSQIAEFLYYSETKK